MADLKHWKSLRQSKSILDNLGDTQEQRAQGSALFPLKRNLQAAHCSWIIQKAKEFGTCKYWKNKHCKGKVKPLLFKSKNTLDQRITVLVSAGIRVDYIPRLKFTPGWVAVMEIKRLKKYRPSKGWVWLDINRFIGIINLCVSANSMIYSVLYPKL